MNYDKIPVLSNIFLEDSYVLVIHESVDSLVFELEVVLTKEHPSYDEPKQGEQYCYKRALLSFLHMSSCEWLDKNNMSGFLDAAGEIDYGNIDTFVKSDDCYMLSGDWGRVVIRCAFIEFLLVD